MAVTTTRRPEPVNRLVRVDRAERILHWVNAALFAVVMFTAGVLYTGQLSALVGRRDLVRQIHVVAGLALPVPILVCWAARWGMALRADLRRLNRWDADDWRWLRSRGRDPSVRLGKFNPGQKLNAAFTAGAIAVMVVTGSVMKWFGLFPLDWRTGATFVHDWVAIGLFLTITGHVLMALREPTVLGGMLRGWVPGAWARQHRPRWYDEESASGRTG